MPFFGNLSDIDPDVPVLKDLKKMAEGAMKSASAAMSKANSATTQAQNAASQAQTAATEASTAQQTAATLATAQETLAHSQVTLETLAETLRQALPAAEGTHVDIYNKIGALEARPAPLKGDKGDPGLPGASIKGDKGDPGDKGAPGQIQALGIGTINVPVLALGGTSANLPVTWDVPMPTAVYQIRGIWLGLTGRVSFTEVSKTTTGAVVKVKAETLAVATLTPVALLAIA